MAYYEKNLQGEPTLVTPKNIVADLVGCRIPPEEAERRIQRLLDDQAQELTTLVDKNDWKYVYDSAKEKWARYDGYKPKGDDLKEIRRIIKIILKDRLKIEPNGDFMKLNKATFNKNIWKIDELLLEMI